MVDFNKLRLKRERFTYRYRCARCGEVIDYVCELPEHMLEHDDPMVPRSRRCRGKLALVAKVPAKGP